MLYKNTKAMVHSPDEDTNFFDIINGVLQRDISTVLLCLDYEKKSADQQFHLDQFGRRQQ